jgi:hypothetical protein
MEDTDGPWAVLVLVVRGHELALGAIDGPGAGALGLVDDLLRLQLALGRHGSAVRLAEVRAELHELLDLVGVAERLGLAPLP